MKSAQIIRVRVIAGAKKERVQQKGDVYVLEVREPAQQNLANGRVRELLARELHVPVKSVRFSAGVRSPNKRFEIIR